MYLKQLYRHNKLLFLGCVLFACAQLFINYKRGVVFSPFYHYGMFSGVIPVENKYNVTEVYVNEKQLLTKDYSPVTWDKIIQPVELFYKQPINKTLWQQDIHRLLPFADSLKYVNQITETDFKNWYGKYLQSVLDKPIDSVRIVFANYSFNGKSLLQTK